MMSRSVVSLNVGMCVLLRMLLWVMRIVGKFLRVDPERIECDVSALEVFGNICILYLMIHSIAAILCAVGRAFQVPIFSLLNRYDSGHFSHQKCLEISQDY